jgi:hypothetical protein
VATEPREQSRKLTAVTEPASKPEANGSEYKSLQRESPRPGERKRNAFEQNENKDHGSAAGDPKLKTRNKDKACVVKEQISGGQMEIETKWNRGPDLVGHEKIKAENKTILDLEKTNQTGRK